MDRTIVHAQNLTSRVYQKFMQPSMLTTSQQVLFLQTHKWNDTNIRLSCTSVAQCKKMKTKDLDIQKTQAYGSFFSHRKRYDQGLSKKILIWELFSPWKRAVENTDFWGISFLLWYQFIHKFNIICFYHHFMKIKY